MYGCLDNPLSVSDLAKVDQYFSWYEGSAGNTGILDAPGQVSNIMAMGFILSMIRPLVHTSSALTARKAMSRRARPIS